jgi:hypothetical protein
LREQSALEGNQIISDNLNKRYENLAILDSHSLMEVISFDIEVDKQNEDEVEKPFHLSQPVQMETRYRFVYDCQHIVQNCEVVSMFLLF